METLHFAHLSDTHIVGDNSWEFMHQVRSQVRDPLDTLKKSLEQLKNAAHPLDFVLLTGDLVHEGEEEEYRAFRTLFDAALPGVPLACALGNHDHREAFRRGFLGQPQGDASAYCVTQMVKGLRIVTLDSPYLHGTDGCLPEDQLDYLEQAVQTPAPRGTILIMHHPVTSAEPWARMEPPARLQTLIEKSDICAVFAGHLHCNYYTVWAGVPHFTAGSLAFGIDMEPEKAIYTDYNSYALCSQDGNGCFAVHQVTVAPALRVIKVKGIGE